MSNIVIDSLKWIQMIEVPPGEGAKKFSFTAYH